MGEGLIAIDAAGNLHVADCEACTIRRVATVGTNWVVTTLAGKPNSPGTAGGTKSDALFNAPVGITVDRAGNLYVVDDGFADPSRGGLLPGLGRK